MNLHIFFNLLLSVIFAFNIKVKYGKIHKS